MVGEDILDRFVVTRIEHRTDSIVLRAMSRMLLNPARATTNVAAVQAPWYRGDRPLRHIVVPWRALKAQGSGLRPGPWGLPIAAGCVWCSASFQSIRGTAPSPIPA